MNKLTLLIGIYFLLVNVVCAQNYTTGQADIFGNKTTTVKDQYGNKVGTATTGKKDIFGNTTTTIKDIYGNPIE